MTATGAMSASNANPFPDLAPAGAALRTVLLPGSPATYANRATLREMGLRWDPVGHRWHGTTTEDRVKVLREQLGLEVRCFGALDTHVALKGPAAPKPVTPVLATNHRVHDGSRTHFESRTAFTESADCEEESPTPTRRFSLLEITSGLSDDSREEDERVAARRLLDLRGRVKAARAAISATPGAEEVLHRDWVKAARFYLRFQITEAQFRNGVAHPPEGAEDGGPGTTFGFAGFVATFKEGGTIRVERSAA